MTIHRTKAQIRQACLAQRRSLSQEFMVQAAQKIKDSLQNLPIFQTAQHIAGYIPVRGEVDLSALWQQALELKKFCYFPSIQSGGSILFLPYTLNTTLQLNAYHIPEPQVALKHAISLDKLDLIIVPMVAFDPQRRRLGMGKGYYDKAVANHPHIPLIGIAYEWQKQMDLPNDPWDIAMTMIVTEEKIYS